jgi:hypothetical protein
LEVKKFSHIGDGGGRKTSREVVPESAADKGSLPAKDQPKVLEIKEKNDDCDDPPDDRGNSRVYKLAHFSAVAGELN